MLILKFMNVVDLWTKLSPFSISGTGSLLVSHVDRLVSDDLTSMLHKLGTNGKLELHIIGAFADSMGISETLLVPILGNLHYLSLIM